MKPLTAHQQAIWDLRQAGKTRHEIGEALNISPNNVSKTVTIIHKKLGITDAAKKGREERRPENANPELAAMALDHMSDPLAASIKRFASESGVSYNTAYALVKRLRARSGLFISQVRDLKTRELSEMIGGKIHLMLGYLDDAVVSQASARDLSMAIAQLTEKRQLLRGEPTAIVSDHERREAVEIGKRLLTEMRRRGITIDGQARAVNELPEVVNAGAPG